MTQGLGNTLLQYLQSRMDNCTKNVGERASSNVIVWWSSPSSLSWWSPLPMNIKTTSRSTAMVSPKISLFFSFLNSDKYWQWTFFSVKSLLLFHDCNWLLKHFYIEVWFYCSLMWIETFFFRQIISDEKYVVSYCNVMKKKFI